jgi:uncharacterized membrane protein YadS
MIFLYLNLLTQDKRQKSQNKSKIAFTSFPFFTFIFLLLSFILISEL